jgi:hypothetical protein
VYSVAVSDVAGSHGFERVTSRIHLRVFKFFSFRQFLLSSLIYLDVLYRINRKVNLLGPKTNYF